MKLYKQYESKRCWSLGTNFSLSKNKSLEFTLSCTDKVWSYFNLRSHWTRQRDHAGCNFEIGLLGLNFEIELSDGRHWNSTTGKWCEYKHPDTFPHTVKVDGENFYLSGEFKTLDSGVELAKYERTSYNHYGFWRNPTGEMTPVEEG